MSDSEQTLIQGEKTPLYGTIAAASGTVTINSCLIYLRDYDTLTPVSGWNGIAATGFDTGAGASKRAWHTIDSAAIPIGGYLFELKITFTGSDAIQRVRIVSIDLYIQEP